MRRNNARRLKRCVARSTKTAHLIANCFRQNDRRPRHIAAQHGDEPARHMKIIYPPYVLKRMIERGITVADVRDVLENGELIEEYKADSPPRYLMLGWSGNRPLHVVGEDDPVTEKQRL